MYMYDMFLSPITYKTDVNGFLYNYYNSQPKFQYCDFTYYQFGKQTGENAENFYSPLFGSYYTFGGNCENTNSITGGIINFGEKTYNFTGSGKKSTTTKTSVREKAEESVKTDKTTKKNPVSKPDKKAEAAKAKNIRIENIKLRHSFVTNAQKYLGYNEKDGSSRRFSNSPEWCADFVTYVVKESYKQAGRRIPDGFGNHRCENIKQWAIDNNVFLKTAGKSNKAKIIKEKVRPGDILILRENGASHIGIVSKVNADGSFKTIEGNVTQRGVDKVTTANYSPDNSQISGFVQLV